MHQIYLKPCSPDYTMPRWGWQCACCSEHYLKPEMWYNTKLRGTTACSLFCLLAPMHYVGVDIIEIARIERAIARWGERFLRRVYTEAELSLYRNRVPALAVRFAAKEAVMKTLGTGIKGTGWREIETLSNPQGKPWVRLQGRAQRRAQKLGLEELDISLSHSREYALASVVGGSSENRHR